MKQTIKPEDFYPEDVAERRFNRLLELVVTGQQTGRIKFTKDGWSLSKAAPFGLILTVN